MEKSKQHNYKYEQISSQFSGNDFSKGRATCRWRNRSRFKNSYVGAVGRQDYTHIYTTRYKPFHSPNVKNKSDKKALSRPSSPVLGSEEYMDKKIQQTSALIMRHLLNPDECVIENSTNQINNHQDDTEHKKTANTSTKNTIEKSTESMENKIKNHVTYNIEEIQQKILNHITNLNNGKRKNLVYSNNSSYDIAIQQIQKQKRLEISRAFRNMCSQSETEKSSDFINSIIPDIGIKIEDLPRSLIEELSHTLNLNCEDMCDDGYLLSSQSPDIGYWSLGENRSDNISNENHNFENVCINEDLDIQTLVKQEPNDDPPSMTDLVTSANDVENSDIFGDITIKKEPDQYLDEKYTAGEVLSDITDKLVPVVSKEISNNLDVSATEIKEEHNQFPEEEPVNSNSDRINELTSNGDNNCDTLYLHNASLPVNPVIEDEEKETADDNLHGSCTSIPQIGVNNVIRSISNISTQTEERYFSANTFIDTFLQESGFEHPPENISGAIDRMFKIDECISKLTEYRQNIFRKLKDPHKLCDTKNIEDRIGYNPVGYFKKKKKRKKNAHYNQEHVPPHGIKKCKAVISNDDVIETSSVDISLVENNHTTVDTNQSQTQRDCSVFKTNVPPLLNFQDIHEKMLVIKACESRLVAAGESGNVYIYSLDDGSLINKLRVSNVPITAVWFEKIDTSIFDMYIGSFETKLKVYNLQSYRLNHRVSIDDSIQCLESSWGYIFMGCLRGTFMRYSIKKKAVEYEDKWSDDRILVIKATQEGARRILLVGSRNSPVCIRDAITGLYMRTMENIVSPTVYSLIKENSLIYCGTTNHDILVFSFHDGKLFHKYEAASSKGISCLKIIKNLLFASCHNGSIYVYDIKRNTFVDTIQGPGGVILSMEVLENQVIIGTMLFKFESLPIPEHIMKYNNDES